MSCDEKQSSLPRSDEVLAASLVEAIAHLRSDIASKERRLDTIRAYASQVKHQPWLSYINPLRVRHPERFVEHERREQDMEGWYGAWEERELDDDLVKESSEEGTVVMEDAASPVENEGEEEDTLESFSKKNDDQESLQHSSPPFASEDGRDPIPDRDANMDAKAEAEDEIGDDKEKGQKSRKDSVASPVVENVIDRGRPNQEWRASREEKDGEAALE